jgi:hypothetical protein
VDLLVPWRRLERSGEREGAGSRLARAEERRAGCGGVGPVRRGAPPPLEERRRCLKRRGTARERGGTSSSFFVTLRYVSQSITIKIRMTLSYIFLFLLIHLIKYTIRLSLTGIPTFKMGKKNFVTVHPPTNAPNVSPILLRAFFVIQK